jgi:hypothetical protein
MNKVGRLSKEEIQKKLKDIRSGELRVMPVNRGSSILSLIPYVKKVLKALGHSKMWVSDSSTVWDFSPNDTRKNSEYIAKASIKLGFIVNNKDYIIDLAMRLKEKELNV